MELFYSKNISQGGTCLDQEESNHCIKVLRHHNGDRINVVDGHGMLYICTIVSDNAKCVEFEVEQSVENYGSHDYRLHMAVAPPKNSDRFDWFAEKATEIGVDEITPLFGDYSERKVFKGERVGRILVAAAKQSHKGAIPKLNEAVTVREFLTSDGFGGSRKLICYCDEVSSLGVEKVPIGKAVEGAKDIVIMIGPEGDFSRSEIQLAVEKGWQIVSLGDSRLRIETAAMISTAVVYLKSQGV